MSPEHILGYLGLTGGHDYASGYGGEDGNA